MIIRNADAAFYDRGAVHAPVRSSTAWSRDNPARPGFKVACGHLSRKIKVVRPTPAMQHGLDRNPVDPGHFQINTAYHKAQL
jgi:hypothetical protein